MARMVLALLAVVCSVEGFIATRPAGLTMAKSPVGSAVEMNTQFTDPYVQAMKKKNKKTGASKMLRGYRVGSKPPPMAIRSGTTIDKMPFGPSRYTDSGDLISPAQNKLNPATLVGAAIVICIFKATGVDLISPFFGK